MLPEGLPQNLSVDSLIAVTREPDPEAVKKEQSLRNRAMTATHALVTALYRHGPGQLVEAALDDILATDANAAGCLIACEEMIGLALAPHSQADFTNALGLIPPGDALDVEARAHGDRLAAGLVVGYAQGDAIMANAGAVALRGPDAGARQVLYGLAMIVAFNWRRSDSIRLQATETFEVWKQRQAVKAGQQAPQPAEEPLQDKA